MPGKSYRRGIALIDAIQRFSDEASVERRFIEARSPNGVARPKCSSLNIQERPTRKRQPFGMSGFSPNDFSILTDTRDAALQHTDSPSGQWRPT